MGVRKTAVTILTSIVLSVSSGLPILAPAVAQAAASPAAAASSGTTASLSAADKEKVRAKLKAAKQLNKKELKDAPQSAQAEYDAKIKDLNRLIDKLNKSEDVNLSDVDKAVAPPGSGPK